MKKGIVALPLVLALLLALLCPASLAETYEGEILFRGLPWLSDVNTYSLAIIEDMGVSQSPVQFSLFLHNGVVLYFTGDLEEPLEMVSYLDNKAGYLFSVSQIRDDVSVAGYPISRVSGYAIYSVKNGKVLVGEENSQVISASYKLDLGEEAEESEFDSVYYDLQQKLNSVYGPSHDVLETQTDDGTIKRSSVWYGGNNTYALLEESYLEGYEYNNLSIQYGTLDAAILAEALLNPENTIDNSSTEGL